jgi:conjugal transfer pilus assembly protein TrbC
MIVVLGVAGPVTGNEPYRAPDAVDTTEARAASRDAVGQAQTLARDPDQLRALTGAAPLIDAPTRNVLNAFIDPQSAVLEKSRIDVQKLLEQHSAASATTEPDAAQNTVLVFVSFSMPEASLKALLDASAQTGTPLVLRGMVDGSMQRTLARLRALATGVTPNGPQPTVMIDPTAYARFAVDQVPSFVFALEPIHPCECDTCPTPAHLKVSGDVSLSYALDMMSRQAKSPAARAQVQAWLKRSDEPP